MTKKQWHQLYSAYRHAKRLGCNDDEVLAWIAFYSRHDRDVLAKII
jgi:HD superfamily phosphohydrolase YqeK